CHEAPAAILVIAHVAEQLERLVALVPPPFVEVVVDAHPPLLDDARRRGGEEPPDIGQPPHAETNVRPPTTTLRTSAAEQQNIRYPRSSGCPCRRSASSVMKSASIPATSSPDSQPSALIPWMVAAR